MTAISWHSAIVIPSIQCQADVKQTITELQSQQVECDRTGQYSESWAAAEQQAGYTDTFFSMYDMSLVQLYPLVGGH